MNNYFKIFLLFSPCVIFAQDTLEISYFSKVEIKLDGKLIESVYDSACKIDSLAQIYPVYGEKFPESTIVYIFQTDKGIYFGFHCATKNRSPDKSSSDECITIC